MKSIRSIITAVLLIVLCSCGGTAGSGEINVDLTTLSSTMVYAEVSNILKSPETYLDKTIKVSGPYTPSYYEETDSYYHYVVIADATACCSQGLEFIWNGDHKFPTDYPESGKTIEIIGKFGSYEELGVKYYCIFTDEVSVK